MNKKELVAYVAMTACISNREADRAISALLGAVTSTMKKGERVNLHGLGVFSATTIAQRSAKNPRTGQPITIPSRRAPKLSPSIALRRELNT